MAKLLAGTAALALVALGIWQWEWDAAWLEGWIGEHRVLGAGIYTVFVAASVVLLPFSSLPLLPLATLGIGAAVLAGRHLWRR